MNCIEIQDKLTTYLLGELDAVPADEIRGHLRECPKCQARAREIEATIALLRKDLLAATSEFPQRLSAERRQAIFARFARPANSRPRNKRKPLFEFSFWGLAASLVIMAVMASLFLPRLGSVRESARRVNDLSNLNGIYKAAAGWGMDTRDSFRPAFPDTLDELAKDKTISPAMLVNPETGTRVEYYPARDDTDGERVLLVSRGKKGRNIVKVSGSGMWVEDGTPEAAKLDQQLAELKKQGIGESYAFSAGAAGSRPDSSVRPAAAAGAITLASKIKSEMPYKSKTLGIHGRKGEKEASEKKAEVSTVRKHLDSFGGAQYEEYEKPQGTLGAVAGFVALPAPAARAQSSHETAADQPGNAIAMLNAAPTRTAAKTAARRITTTVPASFTRAEAPAAAPAIQMAEIKVDTDMAKSINDTKIERLQRVREFQKDWVQSYGDGRGGGTGEGSINGSEMDESGKGSGSGSGGGGGAGGGAAVDYVSKGLVAGVSGSSVGEEMEKDNGIVVSRKTSSGRVVKKGISGVVVGGDVALKGKAGRVEQGGGDKMLSVSSSNLPPLQVVRQTPEAVPAADAAPAKIMPKRALGVNPFVNAAENNFSTFGIDVDTASYTLARNSINRGELPPPEEVRTEEFVNYFNYAYQPPRDKSFAVYSEIGAAPFGRGLALLKIGVQAQRLGREQKRPLALTLLIDTSGSMATPDRIELLKSALRRMIARLDPNDLVAVVQFDSQARLLLAHTPASEKSKILAVIDALQTSGSTNLEEGMKLAYAVAARAADSRRLSRVILLSDGVANLGTVAAEEILGSAEKYRKQGVYCSVFGFGSGAYNDAMLQTLADKGDGAYAFVDSDEEAERALVEDLAARMNVVARDAKIQVEFNPKRVIRFRQLGYEKRQLKKEQFRDDTVDAGEVGSGQCATALYELELNRNYTEPIGTVRVRYKNVLTDVVEEIEQPIVLQSQPPAFGAMGAHFRLAAGVAEFAGILRGSPYAAGRRLEDVARVLRPVALELNVDRRIAELVRLTECGLVPKFKE